MLDHVTLRAADLAASRRFYETVLATLGIHRGYHAAFVLDPDGNNVEVLNHNR